QKELYPDDVLIGKIHDRAGHSPIRFTGSSRPANRAHYADFCKSLAYCIGEADSWRACLFAWLDEVAAETPHRDIVGRVFNPSDFIGALVYGWPDQLSYYLPHLEMFVDAPPPDGRILDGALTWNGSSVGLLDAVRSVYEEPFQWVVSTHIAIPWEQDLDLLARLNLNYSLFEWSDKYKDGALLELSDG